MTDQPTRQIPWGRIALVLALLIVMGAGALGLRLVNRCINWHGDGMGLSLDQQPVAIARNLAGLVSEPVCAHHVDAAVWMRLAEAYHRVPEIDDLNRRRALGSWQEASLLAPRDPAVLTGLAKAFIDLGQFNYALRPASAALRVDPGNQVAGRQLVSIYLSLEDELAAADMLIDLFANDDAVFAPLWARLAVETIVGGVNEDAVAVITPLSEQFNQLVDDDSVRFAQAVSLAFQFGLNGDSDRMADALKQLPVADAAAGDRLDVMKLYEQLGLIAEIRDGMSAVRSDELSDGEKLRLARTLWLLEDNAAVLERFADDLTFKRQDPEGALIITLASLAEQQPMHFTTQLRESGDDISTWDQRLEALQQTVTVNDAVLAEAMLDRVMGLRDLLPRSGVLSILSAAIWEQMEEPELVQSNLATARFIMGAPLNDLDRIPRPQINFRDDPARAALSRCSTDALGLNDQQDDMARATAVAGCWDQLIAQYPGSMLVVRAAIGDTRLSLTDPKRRDYLTLLEANSPFQAAFWRRAKARDLLKGQPDEELASEALLLLRPLLQQPQPRADTLVLAGSAYGALHDTSRAFRHLGDAILQQPAFAPMVHGISLDIYADEAVMVPRMLIKWWEVFAVLEAKALFGGGFDVELRDMIINVVRRRLETMNNWALAEEDADLIAALSSINFETLTVDGLRPVVE
ncbi:MAG: hypothetical protein KI792_04830 [Alphaproteobacteria bacterium]|nr:hypothetical protein [Alphaproteobacteria bacterium SS10]